MTTTPTKRPGRDFEQELEVAQTNVAQAVSRNADDLRGLLALPYPKAAEGKAVIFDEARAAVVEVLEAVQDWKDAAQRFLSAAGQDRHGTVRVGTVLPNGGRVLQVRQARQGPGQRDGFIVLCLSGEAREGGAHPFVTWWLASDSWQAHEGRYFMGDQLADALTDFGGRR